MKPESLPDIKPLSAFDATKALEGQRQFYFATEICEHFVKGRRFPAMYGVYILRCLADGRIYVGSSKRMFLRWLDHIRVLNRGVHGNILLQRAWDKHGARAFRFEIVELIPNDDRRLEREGELARELDVFNPKIGFNLGPVLGGPISEEARQHLIEAFNRPETLLKKRLSNKVAAALKWKDDDYVSMMKAAHNTPEAKKHHGAATSANWQTPEFRAAVEAIFASDEFLAGCGKTIFRRKIVAPK
jgi:group I intron endonuclease